MSTITYTDDGNVTLDPANATTTYGTRTHPLSEEACLGGGGHCYEERGGTDYTTGELVYNRTCKHCGKYQWGTPQQDIRWEDA